jgi:hypothetical protein
MIQYCNYQEEMELTCDVCCETDYLIGTWQECLDEAKSQGWKVFKNSSDEWEHRCRECKEKPRSIDPMEFITENDV